jgi:hypothetical protein
MNHFTICRDGTRCMFRFAIEESVRKKERREGGKKGGERLLFISTELTLKCATHKILKLALFSVKKIQILVSWSKWENCDCIVQCLSSTQHEIIIGLRLRGRIEELQFHSMIME